MLVGVAGGSPWAWADDFEWTGAGPFLPTAFTFDANWVNVTTGGPTDTDGIPDLDDTVIFTIDATVANGSAKNFVIEPQATLTVGGGTIAVGHGAVTNDGVIRTGAEPSFASLGVIGNATLTGGGELVMAGGTQGITPNGVTLLTHEAGHTVRGHGSIDVGFVNEGTLFADSAAGPITFGNATASVDVTLDTASGTAAVLLDGVGFADSGAFLFTSPVDLGGGLRLVAGENLQMGVGDTYTFLTYSGSDPTPFNGTVFDGVDQSGAGPYVFDVVYDQSTVSVLVTGVGMPGDANFDGVVDLLDFDVLAQNFGSAGVGFAGGDFNGDGVVDLLDFDVLAQNFGASGPATVPEPGAIAVLGLVGLMAARRRR